MHIPPDRIAGAISFQLIRPPNRRSTFHADLLSVGDDHIVLAHQVNPSKPLIYRGEEVIAPGYWMIWFLFRGQPWDVARCYRPDGTFTGFYADVLEPVHWEGHNPPTLAPLVDLFLDLWVAPDGSYAVLDEDEFEDAVQAGVVSQPQAAAARSVLCSLVSAAERGDFPPPLTTDFRL